MCLADLFICTAILEGGPALSKADLVSQLLRVLADAGHVPHADLASVREAVLRREALGSTGIGRGVAVPHAKHAAVPRVLGCLGVCRTPVGFDALDGETIDLIALLLSPPDLPGLPGGASRDAGVLLSRLSDREFCRRLRQAGSVAEMEAVLRAGDGMTRREWEASDDPAAMLRFVRTRGLVGARKARLCAAAHADPVGGPPTDEGRNTVEVAVLRCLFAPPPHGTIAIRPEWLAFCDGVVGKLAWGIEEEGDFSRGRMGVLADALEDAGADAVLIEHLRRPEPHARGCFVIELLTGQGCGRMRSCVRRASIPTDGQESGRKA
jgi:PTS system fructose-specific IIA component/PTS system nitrogen regulatory IIA component